VDGGYRVLICLASIHAGSSKCAENMGHRQGDSGDGPDDMQVDKKQGIVCPSSSILIPASLEELINLPTSAFPTFT